ncbi:MAG TPA: formate dehydrogenase subunit delta [Candidatus Sulfotelmatobacter sp.]|nr:formate dehydrogenase subunit delta [Candidatus Sulfotelmatobacter sp.]
MRAERLVTMANQIASFYEPQPDRATAANAVAGHLRRFWAPAMRRDLQLHVDQTGGEGVSALVLEALRTPTFAR